MYLCLATVNSTYTYNNLIIYLQNQTRQNLKEHTYKSNLSRIINTHLKCRLLEVGSVNVNRLTSSTPHSVSLPSTKKSYLKYERVLRPRFMILQGTGRKHTGCTPSDNNAVKEQIYDANLVSSCPLRIDI